MLTMLKKETVAVIDVGSNSIKLLIAERGSDKNSIESVHKETRETRISTGISKENPELTRESMDAGCQSISELVSVARGHRPKIIKIVATSAVRDATNGIEFIKQVNEATGVRLEILSGIQEANYIGKGLRCDPQVSAMENFLQMDIGGGSLELIRFSHSTIQKACSLQLGAVRLTEKFVLDRTVAITSETKAHIQTHIRESLKTSGFSFEPATDPMIVTGGAFSVIRSILGAKAGTTIESASSVIHKKNISELKSTLCNLSLNERKTIPGLSEARADVMPVALITIDTVLESAGRDTITHSFYNLRYGIATELLA
jgi:exopolyphosphatase/guanosine-5'-triphosphate,3'-diphosphate pyrophosphatase